MLVLSRKVDERIQIGDNITITVVQVRGNSVRIAIDAPKSVRILRSELEGTAAKPQKELKLDLDAIARASAKVVSPDAAGELEIERQGITHESGTVDPGLIALYEQQPRNVPIPVKRRYFSCVS
jgi:carbon storage regulator CsrA